MHNYPGYFEIYFFSSKETQKFVFWFKNSILDLPKETHAIPKKLNNKVIFDNVLRVCNLTLSNVHHRGLQESYTIGNKNSSETCHVILLLSWWWNHYHSTHAMIIYSAQRISVGGKLRSIIRDNPFNRVPWLTMCMAVISRIKKIK